MRIISAKRQDGLHPHTFKETNFLLVTFDTGQSCRIYPDGIRRYLTAKGRGIPQASRFRAAQQMDALIEAALERARAKSGAA